MNNKLSSADGILPDALYPYPRICAHRGYSTVAPENTLPAFVAAVELNAPEIEMDVRFSKDGVPVVCHDDSLERISNGTGMVQEKTLAELKELDFGSHAGKEFAGIRIATFEEILEKFSRKVIINLHIKSLTAEIYPEDQFRKIVDLLRKYDHMEHVYIMASPEIMERALQMAPEIPRCMSAGIFRDGHEVIAGWEIVDRAIQYKCSKVQLFTPYYDQALIDKAHANNIRCNFFFSDDPEEAVKLLEMGVDTLLTNDYLTVANATKHLTK